MAVLGVIALFLIIGSAVIFVAYAGGGSAAREAYLTRGRTFFRIAIPVLYIGLGIAIPAVVIANHDSKEGAQGALATKTPDEQLENGKEVFMETCASCHTLKAVNARGVTGPDLDNIGQMTKERVTNANTIGGTGQRRMPANLVAGEDAEDDQQGARDDRWRPLHVRVVTGSLEKALGRFEGHSLLGMPLVPHALTSPLAGAEGTGTARTSTTGRSPSVRMLSPPPFREW